jgi:stage II sporulation protein D
MTGAPLVAAALALLAAGKPRPLPPPLPLPDAIERPPTSSYGPSPRPAGSEAAPADQTPAEVPPAPDDPVAFLYAHRINFAAGGAPLVTVRLMEGQRQISLSGIKGLRLTLRGEVAKQVRVPPGALVVFTLRAATPAWLRYYAQIGDFAFADRDGLARERELWEQRGYPVKAQEIGTIYGIAGRVLDNRRWLLLLGPGQERAAAEAQIAEVGRRFGAAASLAPEELERARGALEVKDGAGTVLAGSNDLVIAEAEEGGTIEVRQVEYGVGYAAHGFADRSFPGRIFVAIDPSGALAAIDALPLEELLRGLVPSEMYASAPPEALKAQAVTARGEVLAKIGVRHLTDPYLLCSEQHCQVYSGLGGRRPSTDAAVAATRGEALFSSQGRLVNSVYSSVCGGHTEDNQIVWRDPPDSSLRGVSDLIGDPDPGPLQGEANLRQWVATEPASYCKDTGLGSPSRFRWSRRFSAEEIDRLVAPFGVGRVRKLVPLDRGVSGRAARLLIVGERGQAEVHGELVIRRLLKNLNSSAFVVEAEPGTDGRPRAFVFAGAGWGHGVGMCQTGAIGRAQRGQNYREILSHYFNGARIAKIY